MLHSRVLAIKVGKARNILQDRNVLNFALYWRMFEITRLIAKKDNKITDPGPGWNMKTKIHCCCALHVGLGDKYEWTPHHSMPLSRLVEFYKELGEITSAPLGKTYQYTFVNNGYTIVCAWVRTDTTEFNFTIRYKSEGRDNEVFRKKLFNGIVYSYWPDLYFQVMNILTQSASEAACVKAGELFYKQDGHPYEFRRGQKVTTRPHLRQQRTGYIISCYYHQKNKTNIYQLLVNGKRVDRWYLPGDLIKI